MPKLHALEAQQAACAAGAVAGVEKRLRTQHARVELALHRELSAKMRAAGESPLRICTSEVGAGLVQSTSSAHGHCCGLTRHT